VATPPQRFLVLVTGLAAAGKSTLAPRLADELGALWLSRDDIHAMVYSGWEPQHPALTAATYDPEVGDSTFYEGRVVWNIFLWMLARTTAHVPVVADTPFNHDWNRALFEEARPTIAVPMAEVALHGDAEVLLARATKRASDPGMHEIKARFSLNPLAYYERGYQPVLPEEQVVHVDVTELSSVDPADVAERVWDCLGTLT